MPEISWIAKKSFSAGYFVPEIKMVEWYTVKQIGKNQKSGKSKPAGGNTEWKGQIKK